MGSDSEHEPSVLRRVVHTALIPVQVVTSKPAQKAYLRTFLFVATSFLLLGASTLAYILFYYNFVPQIGVERTIHLQFGNGHPYGTADLSSTLTSLQPYDISLFLHLPRSPGNLAAGNFMVDLALLSPKTPTSTAADLLPAQFSLINSSTAILARSRRPAILTYASPIVDTAHKLSGLPWYILGWRKESEVLDISMFEGVEFSKGRKNVPDKIQVVIEADEKMQFYEVGVKIVARFRGLRYILYNHRIMSFVVFTLGFFAVSMTSTLVAYILLSIRSSSPPTTRPGTEPSRKIKTEPEQSESEAFNPLSTSDLSDTSRTFPTLGRQMPLHFSSRSEGVKREDLKREEEDKVKREEEEEIERTTGIQPLVAEADDEDEDDDDLDLDVGWRDSGIGTSMEEGDRRGMQRRRRAMFGGGKPS